MMASSWEGMMAALLPIIIIVVLVILSFALVIGLSLGLGWLLTLFLPFSLFEATLLGMVAAGVTGVVWRNIFRAAPPFDYEEEGEDEAEVEEIPQTRFWKTSTDQTWENWLRYVMANSIYQGFFDSPDEPALDEEQLQDIAIRLADAALGSLRARSPRTKRLKVNKAMLKQQMSKMGQQPYTDDILNTAVASVNMELVYLDEALKEVMRRRLWNQPAEPFYQ
jgi:hypothetical protein